MYRDFNSVHLDKSQPGVGDVHVTTAMGNSEPGKKKKKPVTTVGPAATLKQPTDVTELAAVDFNHAHFGESVRDGDPPYIVRTRPRNPLNSTIGKPKVRRDGRRTNANPRYTWDGTGVQKDNRPVKTFEEVNGITVAVENLAGETRPALDDHGVTHDVIYGTNYGRIQGTTAPDGDNVDVYLGRDRDSKRVWVINQVDRKGKLTDVKVMLGFSTKGAARTAYQSTHFNGAGEQLLLNIIETTYEKLKEWLAGAHTTEAFPRSYAKKADPDSERKLQPFARGFAKNPLPVHKHALSMIRPDQTPRLFEALTHPKRLDVRKMKFGDLTAIQDRVDPQKVEAIRKGEHNPKHEPVVVRFASRNYVVDGDHHIAADWLDGQEKMKVRFLDISARTEAVTQKAAPSPPGEPHKWTAAYNVLKVDADKQQIFGWASVSKIDGKIVTDKQGDQIYPDELEAAAYDFVLHSRDMGHMHKEKGVGRLIESCVLTLQKQEAMGIDPPLPHESWWIGFHVTSKKVWAQCAAGELPELSIGGVAVPVDA